MKYIIIITITLGVGFYLHWAYARIYSTTGINNLANPTAHQFVDIVPSSAASAKKIVYVALGDSLTAGVGATAENKTYPYQLAVSLANKHQTHVTLVNLAWPGATAQDVLENQVPLAAQFNPDIITLAIGINDMHNRAPAKVFEQTMSTIVSKLVSSTKQMKVINMPYIGERNLFTPPYRAYFDWQTKRYNSLLNYALANQQVDIIDLYSLTRQKAFTDTSYYSIDRFHPSDDGYKFWSTVLYDHLNF